MNGQNLDRLCAQFGYEIADTVFEHMGRRAESHITKSLGVLQEDGMYAFFLYQESRGDVEKNGAKALAEQAHEFLKQAGIEPFDRVDDPLEAVRGNKEAPALGDHLDELLLAKRLLQQALIYARYHVKPWEETK